ncbi:MAG: hypothetical protein E7H57_13015 [Pantoea sp.]|nr:hypothetical protein [Pantoea sp.]
MKKDENNQEKEKRARNNVRSFLFETGCPLQDFSIRILHRGSWPLQIADLYKVQQIVLNLQQQFYWNE